jgi:uncharacterized membrane protein YphA (DoxX/SURF4 family)
MNNWTRFFLVLLRLVIGWHFLFEGLEKLGSPSWSSEVYLRESSGPLAGLFQRMAGDPVIDRVTPPPGDPAQVPPALAKEWQAWFNQFADHYQFDARQRELADAKLKQQMSDYVVWLQQGTKRVTKTSPYGPPVSTDKTMAERVEDYRNELAEARGLQSQELPRSSNTIFASESQAKLRAAKADANRIRSEIRAETDDRTAKMKEALREVLNDDQTRPDYPPLPARARPGLFSMSMLDVADVVVPWGLTATGVCLLVGLFTRSFCLIGAGFLLMFYLAMPPLPGVPENLRAEGHYLYINKNIIEMLALLALATTMSGRWCGLDGLVQFLNPRRWRTKK